MISRDLDPKRGYKPLDFGAGGITGSVDAYGRIIALNTYHPVHGYITLTSAEPFPESERYNPATVRAYRKKLAALEGFGFTLDEPIIEPLHQIQNDTILASKLTTNRMDVAESAAFAVEGGVVQYWAIIGNAAWKGRLCFQRSAYTQLTEGGPIPAPPTDVELRFRNGVLTIRNPALNTSISIAGLQNTDTWERTASGIVEISIPPNETQEHIIAYAFGESVDEAERNALRLREKHTYQVKPRNWEKLISPLWAEHLQSSPDHPLVRRALTYGMMCAVPVDEGVCILTDHMLLPLSWNRDAYYVARALLSWRNEHAIDTVRRHLMWMFEQAERPDGFWARCYLANGRVKDPAFQLDQQLFPLLELAEYTRETGDTTTLRRLEPHIAPLIERLMARKADGAMLFSTDETAADDPIALPYATSSHILFWRTLLMLERAGIDGNWSEMASELREAVNEYFVAERDGKRQYAYATDGRGNFHFYHDANDFPMALAPTWGFCRADDPVWRATIEFAWSEANEGGYYSGRLGSVHTRAAWPLGDVQELVVAKALGDEARMAKARANLEAAAQWDGALSEAVDPHTNEVVSRHWFAWPNAALACFELGAFDA